MITGSKKYIGLLFGSFNPIHNGHIAIAQKSLYDKLVDAVWFIPAIQNPFKNEYSVSFDDRCEMLKIACSNYSNMYVCPYEHDLSGRTYDTLEYLDNLYSDRYHFVIICGDDTYNQISEWYNGDNILESFDFIVFTRDSKEIQNNSNILAYLTINDIEDISSSKIREMIKSEKDVSNYIHGDVLNYINDNEFYK